MARKAKDLFVLLAERHQRRTSSSASSSPSGKRSAKAAKSRDALEKGKDAAATIKAAGGSLGRWVQGAVRTMRGEEPAKPPRRAARKTPAASRRSPPRQVPRGLLVPGWLLVGMLTVALGGGFLIGKFTSRFQSNSGLDVGRAQQPGNFRTVTPDLTPAEEMAELGSRFFVIGTFFPKERDEAAALARSLRDRGVEKARILRCAKDGSILAWATVCYVAPSEVESVVLAVLEKYGKELGYKVVPELQKKKS